MRTLTVAALTASALLLAACGGGGSLSADEYRSQLETACVKLADANAQLPVRMRDEDLDLDQAREIAEDAGAEFEETVRDLDPPSELQDAHDRLLERGDADSPDGDDPAAVRRWVLEIADLYRDLGAAGCEQRQREVAKSIDEAAG